MKTKNIAAIVLGIAAVVCGIAFGWVGGLLCAAMGMASGACIAVDQ